MLRNEKCKMAKFSKLEEASDYAEIRLYGARLRSLR
jgi:hypothetical protein